MPLRARGGQRPPGTKLYQAGSVDFEVKDIRDLEARPVEQHQVATDDHVSIVWGRRRQSAFQFGRAGMHLVAKTDGQIAMNHDLALESGRQAVALGQAGREMVVMIVVPATHCIAIVIGIAAAAVILFMPAAVPMVAIFVIVVAIVLVVTVPVILGYSDCGGEGKRQNSRRAGSKP